MSTSASMAPLLAVPILTLSEDCARNLKGGTMPSNNGRMTHRAASSTSKIKARGSALARAGGDYAPDPMFASLARHLANRSRKTFTQMWDELRRWKPKDVRARLKKAAETEDFFGQLGITSHVTPEGELQVAREWQDTVRARFNEELKRRRVDQGMPFDAAWDSLKRDRPLLYEAYIFAAENPEFYRWEDDPKHAEAHDTEVSREPQRRNGYL